MIAVFSTTLLLFALDSVSQTRRHLRSDGGSPLGPHIEEAGTEELTGGPAESGRVCRSPWALQLVSSGQGSASIFWEGSSVPALVGEAWLPHVRDDERAGSLSTPSKRPLVPDLTSHCPDVPSSESLCSPSPGNTPPDFRGVSEGKLGF